MTHPIITRSEAKAAGLTRYFTGKPCKHGHVSDRLITDNTCAECHRARVYANRTPEQRRRESAAFRAKYPEKVKQTNAAWVKANPVKIATKSRNRQAMKIAAEGRHTPEDILRIYAVQNGKCACCKTKVGKKYDVDHIQPLSKGGSNWPSNLQILCPSCNRSKGARDPIKHRQSLGMLL